MPPRNPSTPDEQPERPTDETTEFIVPVVPGTPTTIEIPPGTTNLTITINPPLQARPPERTFASGLMRSCGCVVLTVFGTLVVLLAIGSIVAR